MVALPVTATQRFFAARLVALGAPASRCAVQTNVLGCSRANLALAQRDRGDVVGRQRDARRRFAAGARQRRNADWSVSPLLCKVGGVVVVTHLSPALLVALDEPARRASAAALGRQVRRRQVSFHRPMTRVCVQLHDERAADVAATFVEKHYETMRHCGVGMHDGGWQPDDAWCASR